MKYCFIAVLTCLLWLSVVGQREPGWGWTYCNCRWDDWKPWSDCNSTCFGTRERTRAVWLTQYPECDEFTDCAPREQGRETEGCNEVCSNGGFMSGSSCVCQAGYNGQCCTTRITCGAPDSINNGGVVYPLGTVYGDTATYTCNQHYNLTGGSNVRTCQLNAAWSGQKPSCAYVNHCASQPCLNGAACTDKLDDYQCTCLSGWSGEHCENDVQPPVMSGCPADMTVYATSQTHTASWTEPTFEDPLQGTAIQVASNYPIPEYEFPSWDDYTVQYVGTKTSNGLQTECIFQIKVRPTPCDELNVPVNGARICNNWKTDFGLVCMVACRSSYTIDPYYFSYDTLYVCGASGNWIAAAPLPDCDIPMDTEDIVATQADYYEFSYDANCTDSATTLALQERYITQISEYQSFYELCSNPAECRPENVVVDC